MLMCGVGAKSVSHLMKFHLLQWEVVKEKILMNSNIIIILGFIERKINTNPLMCLSPRRESPGTRMGRHLKSAHQGITKVGVCQPKQVSL